MPSSPNNRSHRSMLSRWFGVVGALLLALGGSLAPNLIASDVFVWLYTTENFWVYRLVVYAAWSLFAASTLWALRQHRADSAITIYTDPRFVVLVQAD